jgi:hypothetical protein
MNALKVKLAKFNAMDRWYSPKKLKRHQNEGEKIIFSLLFHLESLKQITV